MPSPKAECGERGPYQTVNRRLEAWTERIRERYNRSPTTYELLAIDHLPCLPSTQLFDHSRSGIIIYERLRYAEKTGNPMLLEEAGRLLMLQMTNAWTPAKSIDGDTEYCRGGSDNDVDDGVGRLNCFLLQRYQQRQNDTLVLENQLAPCDIPFTTGAAEPWNKTITGEHIPSSNGNSNSRIHKFNGPRVPPPSRASYQKTFQDVFHPPSAIPRPDLTATTTNSSSTGGSPCPTPSTTDSTSPSYLHHRNRGPASPQTLTNPVLQAHSINGNTYIIPITLHFANAMSNSSIAVHIPGTASAMYPLDLVSGQQQRVATDMRPPGGAVDARGGAGDENSTGNEAGSDYDSVRNVAHDVGHGGHGEVRVEVRVGEGGEPIDAVGQGQG